ncbi:hypothetical protein [Yoonia sediminilitoris]|uniref:Uncharacterized protein n=1 Tax=Yoonia sediminilitoris TaxID=1286148 RepID=A0A2T6KS95_9RHOB|nr:hypothetical protein [Yoonia sediminilitoris]PUB19427.1 hypothetical protein C8N45_1011025 [Yoonia sediminilitoris]RCW99595.1 hypothetical protein DFP92_1011025 [Yoonia sediminilitoris]
MADHSITRDTMLQSLHDIRLPADAPGGLWAELAAAAGLGLALALVFSFLIPLFTRPRAQSDAAPDLAADIAALHALPQDAYQLELLRLVRAHAPALLGPDPQKIYAPEGFPDARALEKKLLETVQADA